MRTSYLPLSVFCLLCFFLLLPVVKAGNKTAGHRELAKAASTNASATTLNLVESASRLLYDSLHLDRIGLSREALLYAFKGQQKLVREGELDNPDVLTVCDFSQPSTSKRMYILDIHDYKVLMNTYVAHGKNSGLDYASRFSNNPSSHKSSLGFYITRNVYSGKHGLSLRLLGLEKGFNDKAEARAVVVHGAKYIGEKSAEAGHVGRSFGCPAVPLKQVSKVIHYIKDGSCLFIYHPTKTYLQKSKILNG